MNLDGWKLIDKLGNVFLQSGSAQPDNSLVATMTEATVPPTNDGDQAILVDTEGVGRIRINYSGTQVERAVVVKLGAENE